MGIGRAGHLEIKLAVKLATQQVSKVMRQSFQLSLPAQSRRQNCSRRGNKAAGITPAADTAR